MDLGAAMLRQWWRPVFGAWLAVYLPVAVVLHALLYEYPAIAMGVLWWLKPAFDRVVLHVLAGAVFGDTPTVAATVRGFPRYARRGLPASLTLYRFDLARSFNLPVWQLEDLSGSVARRRAQVLHRRARSQAVWLTLIGVHFEWVLFFSVIGLAGMILPSYASADWGWTALFSRSADVPLWRELFNHACYVIAVSVVEPFYVAAGFALYLNRRTQLEAWDVELQLRKLEAAHAAPALRNAALLLLAVMALAWSAWPAPAAAAEPQPSRAREAVREVLQDKAFEQHKDVQSWRYTGPGRGGAGDDPDPQRAGGSDWSRFLKVMAELIRILAWALGAAVIAWLVWIAARHAGFWSGAGGRRYRPPDALFGLDIRPESLPDDVPGAAAMLMREGRLREALSLLYRGALVRLVHVRHVEIAASDTEGDCVRRVAAAVPGAPAQYFARLVLVWQGAAYAGRLPPETVAESLVSEWTGAFGPGAAP